ncbi:methionine--tRNA ligase [Prochlorococcus sp. MIT 1341]|uniref:methionine--tRNA ligase n=1 Tax=Prochlorococcus sp. MIT 1341 TaxID=3096221 RepID=UPI002A759107|nr:methionine--tRNA ligase [Prochlorococcus sp. MIT 1341]
MSYTITTPLYYVNDKPHLGSTYTTIACDALARYKRLQGEEVIFITGVDEHGLKIQRTAQENNISPQQHCDHVAKQYRTLWDKWNITNDRFIRTSSSKHRSLVEQLFYRVQANDDIYLGRQQGWYCVGCEEFKDLDKTVSSPICDIHQKKLEWRDEENLFFRLSRYQEQIENLVNDDHFILPIIRRNEIKNLVKKGLHDFSISRVNLNWGIPVPEYKGHTFYVWFDALSGYLSSLIDQQNEIPDISSLILNGWPANVHMIGKDILRFHAVYWPAILISAGLPMPRSIFGHGFLTREGKKMGKSLGNVLDPEILLNEFGIDAVRWYLLKDIQFGSDGDFQQRRFVETINNDLSNTFGNLLNRTVSMSRKWFDNSIPPNNLTELESNYLADKAISTIHQYHLHMDKFNLDKSADLILSLATNANIYLNEQAPWTKIKDQSNTDVVAQTLYSVLETCRISSILLQPFVPNLSQRIDLQLGITHHTTNSQELLNWGLLKSGKPLPEPNPIMSKLEISDLF